MNALKSIQQVIKLYIYSKYFWFELHSMAYVRVKLHKMTSYILLTDLEIDF